MLTDVKLQPHLQHRLLKVQITDPVDQIEKTKSSWEKYPRVGVDLGHPHLHPVLTPGA